MNWPLAAALAAAGLVIGWYLRPLASRLAVPAGEPERICCPQCGQQAVRDPAARNPVARVASLVAWPRQTLPPRCPGCQARTGPPPLLPELATAILLGGLGGRVHPGLVLAAACWLAVCAVPLAWVDAAVRRLPDVLTAPGCAGTVTLLLAAAAASGHWHSLLRAVAGGLGLAAAYLALAVASRGATGLGDAKLAAPLGTLLAWYGWRTLIAGVFAGFLLGAIYGIGLLAARRATGKHRIAFGPFMIAGAFLAVLAAA